MKARLLFFIVFGSAIAACARPTPIRAETLVIGQKLIYHSEILNEDRSIVVRVPEDYDHTMQRYPVLYILDADYFYLQSSAAVQFLSECGYLSFPLIPKLIVVGVVNADRNRDYTPSHAPEQGPLRFPTSGGADSFTDHLRRELIPFIDKQFRTEPYRVLSGWSLGGLFTVHTLMTAPELFSAYIAVSPSLWWNSQEPVKNARSRWKSGVELERPLIITQGSLEGGDINASVRNGIVSLLNDRSITGWEFVEIPDEGHSLVPYKALYEALPALFEDWVVPGDSVAAGLDAVSFYYQQLSGKYGYLINVTAEAYRALVQSALSDGEYQQAEVVARQWLELYPASPKAHYYLGRSLENLSRLDAARESYARACELEESRSIPDAEWLLPFRKSLERIEQQTRE